MSTGEYSRVHFRVKAETKLGQVVGVLGSSYQLGSFDKSKVLNLVTTPESYPIWYTAKPLVLRRHEAVQYEYCIIERGVCVSIESQTTHREFNPTGADTLVEDLFLVENVVDAQKGADIVLSSAYAESKNVSCKLFIVCYHLPVVVKRTEGKPGSFEIEWAESLISKTNGSVATVMESYWLGTVKVPGEKLDDSEMEALVTALAAMNCIPVFIDTRMATSMYQGYCKQVMWPVFHNVDPLDHIHAPWRLAAASASKQEEGSSIWDNESRQQASWADYQAVNEAFAAQLLPSIGSSDVIWVHDYHLMLVPKMLRRENVNNSIVFFMHIPFPPSSIFRTLPCANVLLESTACADVVGFHAFDFGRHYLQSMKRTLGHRSTTLPGGLLALHSKGRESVVSMSHVSIEPDLIAKSLLCPETHEIAAKLKDKYQGKKIVLGIDVCQRLSGGALKLAGFEKMLEDYVDQRKAVVLVQRSLRPGARAGDEETTSAELTSMAECINLEYGSAAGDVAVDYAEAPALTLNQRVGLYLAADVFLLTSIREGLNLLPFEYIYARKDLPNAGVVVASEFSACSSILNGSIKINPFNTQLVSDELEKALAFSEEEQARRRQRDIEFLSSRPSSKWTMQVLTDLAQLERIRAKNKLQQLVSQPLDIGTLVSAYKEAGASRIVTRASRVFVFDYGGTLLNKELHDITFKKNLSAISGRKPSEAVMAALKALSDDPRNAVMVVTGLTRAKLAGVFDSISNLTVATSNGLVYSWGTSMLTAAERDSGVESSELDKFNSTTTEAECGGRSWNCLSYDIDWTAVKQIAEPIITKFTSRTNGTCQSPRIPGIGWSYFGADPDWGEKQAAQLTLELEAALARFDVKVTSQIQGSIEIVPRLLDKGVFVSHFMSRVMSQRADQLPYFSLVMGDDLADDQMFRALTDSFGAASPASWGEGSGNKVKAFTVSVGKDDMVAQFFVRDVQEVESVLTALALVDAE